MDLRFQRLLRLDHRYTFKTSYIFKSSCAGTINCCFSESVLSAIRRIDGLSDSEVKTRPFLVHNEYIWTLYMSFHIRWCTLIKSPIAKMPKMEPVFGVGPIHDVTALRSRTAPPDQRSSVCVRPLGRGVAAAGSCTGPAPARRSAAGRSSCVAAN